MEKGDLPEDRDMLDEYDFSKGTRGRYSRRYGEKSNVVVLSPDVADVFPDSESVNRALRSLISAARQSVDDSSE